MTRNSVFLGKSKTVLIALFVSANLVLNFLATPMALADDSSNLCQSLASNQRTEAQKLRQEAIDARNNGDDEQAVSLDEEAAKADEDAAKLESAAGDCPINDPSEIGKVLGQDGNDSDNLCQKLASDKRTKAQQLRQEAIDARNNGDDEQAVSLDEEAAKADEDAAKLESAAGDCPINDPSEIGKVLGDDDNNDNNGNNTIRKNTVHKNTVHKNTIRQNNGNPTSRNNGN